MIGTTEEQLSACRALDEVLGYFKAGGFEVDGSLVVRFRPSLYVEIGSSLGNDEYEFARLSGSYSATSNEIEILSSSSWNFYRRPWDMSWDAAMAFSISEHEIIHWAIAQIMGDQHEKLPHAWHEALAYAVQIELMPPRLREAVLARYPLEKGFANTLEINEIVYGLDPDHFAVASYWTYKRGTGMEFLKKAIRFEFDMIVLNDFLPD
jgi:hypothetical protein